MPSPGGWLFVWGFLLIFSFFNYHYSAKFVPGNAPLLLGFRTRQYCWFLFFCFFFSFSLLENLSERSCKEKTVEERGCAAAAAAVLLLLLLLLLLVERMSGCRQRECVASAAQTGLRLAV